MKAIHSSRSAHVNGLVAFHSADLPLASSGRALGRLTRVAAALTLSLASAACSSMSASTPPVAPVSTGAAVCHATSAAKVVARRVFVPGGVDVTVQDGAFSVRFAADSSHCVAADWPSSTQRPLPGSCARAGTQTASRASNPEETMLAWESHDGAAPRIDLGVVIPDAPRAFFGFGIPGDRHIAERTFHAPAASAGFGETAPALAPIGHDRFLLAWVDGNSESHQLRAQSVVGWGDPLGPAMVLSPSEASVIGHPSVVVAPTGYGLVTFVASIEGEFDVLATPVSCAMN
jgi:hypothetical protein